MMRFLVDSDTLSQMAKERPNAGVMKKLAEHLGEIATGIVVYHDLFYISIAGKERRTREAFAVFLTSEYFARVQILGYTRTTAEEHARLRRARKTTAPWTDGQIAAIAHENRLIVVTHNRRHFDGYPGLEVVDWFS